MDNKGEKKDTIRKLDENYIGLAVCYSRMGIS